jgi:hypothetical protein
MMPPFFPLGLLCRLCFSPCSVLADEENGDDLPTYLLTDPENGEKLITSVTLSVVGEGFTMLIVVS